MIQASQIFILAEQNKKERHKLICLSLICFAHEGGGIRTPEPTKGTDSSNVSLLLVIAFRLITQTNCSCGLAPHLTMRPMSVTSANDVCEVSKSSDLPNHCLSLSRLTRLRYPLLRLKSVQKASLSTALAVSFL